MIYRVKVFSIVSEAEVDVFLSRNHMARKAWKCTSWSFTGKLCPPCPRALLFEARPVDQQHQLAWEAIRTRNLVFTPDLLTQNLQIPGESCSQYSLRSASFEAQLYHPVFAPSLGADSQRGPGGVATRSPAPSRLSSQHLDPRTPAPSPSAGLTPGAHVPARQVVKIHLFMGGKRVA